MLKFLVTSALVYFVYRFFIAPPAIGERPSSPANQQESSQKDNYDEEYIDYEEVD